MTWRILLNAPETQSIRKYQAEATPEGVREAAAVTEVAAAPWQWDHEDNDHDKTGRQMDSPASLTISLMTRRAAQTEPPNP
jgi:hypothetical protein